MDISGFDLNLLVVLDALLAERNVTRAAKRLRLSQSATSAALGRLRYFVNDPLFIRTRAGLEPTPRALALRAPVERALAATHDVLGVPSFDPAKAELRFRLAMSDYAQLVLLVPLMRVLRAKAPRCSLTVRPLTIPTPDELERANVDLVVSPLGEAKAALRKMALWRDSMITVARRGHPARRGPRSPEALARLPQILVSPEGDGIGIVDKRLQTVGLERFVAARVPNFTLAVPLVLGTDLVATLPRRVAQSSTRLTQMHFPIADFSFDMAAVWHARLDADPAQQWLRAELRELAKTL